LAFVAVTLVVSFLASRPRSPAAMRFLGESLHNTGQLPVRLAVLILVSLIWLTLELGLDVLLGAFAAGMVIRLASTGEQAKELGSKLEAIGFGFFIPIFFIMTGVTFDIAGLLADMQDLLLLPLFLLLFLSGACPSCSTGQNWSDPTCCRSPWSRPLRCPWWW
jgi:Kef-type K+ transport system membrane component KefB